MAPIVSAFFMVTLTVCMLWVVMYDTARYIIPNWLNGFIILLYVAAVILLPLHGWLPAIVAAVVMLVLGLGLFTLGLMGGGDVKLLVALSLWTGWTMATLQFIFLTAIFGGILVMLVLFLRFVLPPLWLIVWPTRNLPRLLTRKQPVPYGVAIAMAFGWMLWMGQVAGLPITVAVHY